MAEPQFKLPSGASLRSGEQSLWYERRSLASYLWVWIGAIFWSLVFLAIAVAFPAAAGLLIIPFLFVLGAFVHRATHEYALTSQRVISKRGIVGRKLREAPLKNVTDSAMDQGWGGRLFNYGDIKLNTAGLGGFEIVWRGIKDPARAREKVDAVMRRQKEVEEQEALVKERLTRLEDRVLTGEITEEQFERAKRRLQSGDEVA